MLTLRLADAGDAGGLFRGAVQHAQHVAVKLPGGGHDRSLGEGPIVAVQQTRIVRVITHTIYPQCPTPSRIRARRIYDEHGAQGGTTDVAATDARAVCHVPGRISSVRAAH